MNTEEWRALKEDPEIQISDQGRVRLAKIQYIIPQMNDKSGYKYVNGVKGYGLYPKVHQLVMKTFSTQPHPKYFIVDHKNRNRADNRRKNLRWFTLSLNNLNRENVKGWWKDKNTGKYCSQITIEGTKMILGVFRTAAEASQKYIEAKRRAMEIFDDYNF